MLLICSWDCCNRFLAITAAALDNKALFVFTSSFNSSRFSCCSVWKNIAFQASTSWSVSLTSATSASAFFKQIAACSWRHAPSTALQTDHHHLWETLMMENSWTDSKMWTTTLTCNWESNFHNRKPTLILKKTTLTFSIIKLTKYVRFFVWDKQIHETGKIQIAYQDCCVPHCQNQCLSRWVQQGFEHQLIDHHWQSDTKPL